MRREIKFKDELGELTLVRCELCQSLVDPSDLEAHRHWHRLLSDAIGFSLNTPIPGKQTPGGEQSEPRREERSDEPESNAGTARRLEGMKRWLDSQGDVPSPHYMGGYLSVFGRVCVLVDHLRDRLEHAEKLFVIERQWHTEAREEITKLKAYIELLSLETP